jgi:hypothetical protein
MINGPTRSRKAGRGWRFLTPPQLKRIPTAIRSPQIKVGYGTAVTGRAYGRDLTVGPRSQPRTVQPTTIPRSDGQRTAWPVASDPMAAFEFGVNPTVRWNVVMSDSGVNRSVVQVVPSRWYIQNMAAADFVALLLSAEPRREGWEVAIPTLNIQLPATAGSRVRGSHVDARTVGPGLDAYSWQISAGVFDTARPGGCRCFPTTRCCCGVPARPCSGTGCNQLRAAIGGTAAHRRRLMAAGAAAPTFPRDEPPGGSAIAWTSRRGPK